MMNFDLISITLICSIIYSLFILFLAAGMFRLKKPGKSRFQPVSICVAARNEESQIKQLVKAVFAQQYPQDKFELIIVDDRSSDNTYNILTELSSRYTNLKISRIKEENPLLVGKKGALAKAVSLAQHDILAFTDADCVPGDKWLSEIDRLMTDTTDFLCGYSPLQGSHALLGALKNLERSSIFAVIAGTFGWNWDMTSVARNQVYRKSRFLQINGFDGIGDQRSGDDDLLLQKMSPVIRKRNFIFEPEAVVISYDKVKIDEHVNLEVRRASKWALYPFPIKLLTAFIFAFYILLTAVFFLTVAQKISLDSFLIINAIKIFSEFTIITIFLSKIKRLKLLAVFPLAEILYIPYYIYFGLRGTFGGYKWKN